VHVVAATLLDANKTPVAQWNAEALSKMPKTAFNNDYAYNKFGPGPFGLRAAMGAASIITLPAPLVHTGAIDSARTLQLTDVDGRVFSTSFQDGVGAGRWLIERYSLPEPYREYTARILSHGRQRTLEILMSVICMGSPRRTRRKESAPPCVERGAVRRGRSKCRKKPMLNDALKLPVRWYGLWISARAAGWRFLFLIVGDWLLRGQLDASSIATGIGYGVAIAFNMDEWAMGEQ
jgi:hypothetical protein